MSRSFAEELLGTDAGPWLPGGQTPTPEATVDAVLIDVRLDGFGIHTFRHVAGNLRTHPFFSRQQLHAALMDLWSPGIPETRQPMEIPYESTPLWAEDPAIAEMHYGSPIGHRKQNQRNPRSLSVGMMEGMLPGTRLQAALWGESSLMPPDIETGRVFFIGKGRAPCVITRVQRERIPLRRGRIGFEGRMLPVQVSRDFLKQNKQVPFRRLAQAPDYLVIEVASGAKMDSLRIGGAKIPLFQEPGSWG